MFQLQQLKMNLPHDTKNSSDQFFYCEIQDLLYWVGLFYTFCAYPTR